MNRKLRSVAARTEAGEAVRGRAPTHARAHAHTAAAPPRPCVSSQPSAPTDPTTDSPYSYYYERRNAFCRARTKFVALRLPIIKIVNAFQTEVCLAAQRCRSRVSTAFGANVVFPGSTLHYVTVMSTQ